MRAANSYIGHFLTRAHAYHGGAYILSCITRGNFSGAHTYAGIYLFPVNTE